ncbi:hypothetical protein JKF63_04191 [Porcisia hertigi]|uniref:U-box domain-containing protein n=1 Tax=Porcisia hertigi TaxID=2761500 RepID=A0A836L7L4_9TRYP|nr:hypothetical protein JKF63_04191 [Porcisia hertigi]
MNALIDSIVHSDARAELTEAQLQALIGLFTSNSSALLPGHALFRKIHATIAAFTSLEDASLCLRLCFLLCREVSHRDVIFELIETHNAQIEHIATLSIPALAASHAARRSGTTCEMTKDASFLSQLVLVMLASAESRINASHLVEFIGADVESTVEILVLCYGSVCGTLPGVPAAASGLYQLEMATRLIEVLREMTFWTTYKELHSSKGAGSNTNERQSHSTGSVSMKTLSGPYRKHIGQLISYLVTYDFFGSMCVYLQSIVKLYLSSPSSCSYCDGDQGNRAMALPLLRSHLLLLQTLLMLTGQDELVLRKALYHCGFHSKLCAIFMSLYCKQRVCLPEEGSLLLQMVAVLATLTYQSASCHEFWTENSSMLVEAVSRSVVTLKDPRTSAELVAQLARLVVNSHSKAAVVPLLSAWESVLDSGGKHYVSCSLSNPKNRGRLLDISSPSYEALRCMFHVNTADDLPHQGRCGRDNRRQRNSGPGRARSQRRGRSRLRRARLQQRFHLLVQCAAAPTAVAQEQAQVQLDSLDYTGDFSEDESSDNTSDAQEPTSANEVDLSPWRRGPPRSAIPIRYICSLSHSLIRSTPVLSSTGYVFDEDVIMHYLQHHNICPITGTPMSCADLVVDTALKEELSKVQANFL